MKNKLTSRKFWIAVAAFLGSIGGSVTGIATNNNTLMAIGMACSMFSAAIYVAAEAYVDAARESSKLTTTTVSASTNAKEVVESVLSSN